jgi:hypothetical protein
MGAVAQSMCFNSYKRNTGVETTNSGIVVQSVA